MLQEIPEMNRFVPGMNSRCLWGAERAWKHFARLNAPHIATARLWTFLVSLCYLIFLCYILLRRTSKNPSSKGAQAIAAETLLSGRKLYFCVSPGRAGSNFMSSVIGAARDVVALHEPAPKMNDDILKEVIISGKRRETISKRARLKVEAIRAALLGTATNVSYAETSHMFVKTYADVVLSAIAPWAHSVTIIFLHRNLVDVIWSQLRLGWFSPEHSGRNAWYYGVEDIHQSEQSNNVKYRQLCSSLNFSHQIDALYGYNYDVMRRGHILQEYIVKQKEHGRLTNIRVIHVSVEELVPNSTCNLMSFIESLGLEADRSRASLLKRRDWNSRVDKKDRVPVKQSFEDVQARVTALSHNFANYEHHL